MARYWSGTGMDLAIEMQNAVTRMAMAFGFGILKSKSAAEGFERVS